MTQFLRTVFQMLVLLWWFGAELRGDELYETLKRHTCIVVDRAEGSLGTGFLIDRDRKLVVTNYHVAKAGSTYEIYWELTKPEGEPWSHGDYLRSHQMLRSMGMASLGVVVAQDSAKDIAVLWVDNIPSWVNELPIAETKPMEGEVVHFVGHPGDRLPFRYSIGQVNFVGWHHWTYENVGQVMSAEILQFRTQSYFGFSGAPVVNNNCELLGVLSGGGSTHAMAIQAGEIREVLKTIELRRLFSIHNHRCVPVYFQVRFNPTEEWESFEVAPFHGRWWWIRDSEAVPEIRFDWSYADGYQERRYRLEPTYGWVGKGCSPPDFWRKQYKFVDVAGGIELFAK